MSRSDKAWTSAFTAHCLLSTAHWSRLRRQLPRAGHGGAGCVHRLAEGEVLGHAVFRRRQRVVPLQRVAREAGVTAEDGGERRVGHLLQLVQRRAGADAVEQVDVLLHVGRDVVRAGRLLVDLVVAVAGVAHAGRAVERLGHVVLAGDLPAVAVELHAVLVLVLDGVVVPDLARLLRRPGVSNGAAAEPDGLHRVVVHHPVDDVQVVDVLLDDVVAARPEEVVPVVELVGAVRHALGALAEPRLAAVPRAAGGADFADGAVVDLLDRLDVPLLVAALGAGDDGDVLLLGLVHQPVALAGAGRVDAHRLLAEDVLAGLHRRIQVVRAEPRRGGEDDQVHVGGEQLLVGVQPDERAVRGQLHLLDEPAVVLALLVGERLHRVLGPVLECVRDGDDLELRRLAVDLLLGVEDVLDGPHAATAAADEADLDGVAPAGREQPGRRRHRGRHGGGGLQEVTTIRHGKSSREGEQWAAGSGQRRVQSCVLLCPLPAAHCELFRLLHDLRFEVRQLGLLVFG